MVNGESPGPAPAFQARASNSRLTRSSFRWGRPPGAQRIGGIDAVAARQRRCHQRQNPVAGVGPAWRIAQVQALLYQLGKAEVQGQGGWNEQAGLGHQAVVVEGRANAF